MPAVNVIDSIEITEERDVSKVLADWSAFNSGITVYEEFKAAQAVKLFIYWSNKNGTISLHEGDYFTFVISDIFMYEYVHNIDDAEIKNESGEVIATYSIYDNTSNMKEVKITFTDFVETLSVISGDFWILLFVGSVDSTEEKNLEFIINGSLAADSEVTIIPKNNFTPVNHKVGFSLPSRVADGYYIFEWLVYFNMEENGAGGFNTLENFSFEDVLPVNSPHVFLTDEIRRKLNILPADYNAQIGEYTGSDSYPPENRYPVFLYHYNNTDNDIWYNFINWKQLSDGITTIGIDGNNGLEVSDITISDKLFSAKLGLVTRPTAIRFYTISTVKLAESALGDPEIVGLYKNIFNGNGGQSLDSSLTLYRFESGGDVYSIVGDYSFSFIKVNERGAALPGAMFSLFTSRDFSLGADRFAYSGENGIVAFNNLKEGTYYIQETVIPYGFIPNDTIYMVILNSEGFEIYYGENFKNRLSDKSNKIINNRYSEKNPRPCRCPRSTKCRKSIEGKKIWIDNGTAGGTRPVSININLLRDGEIYDSIELETDSDRVFAFCCLPIRSKTGEIHNYQIEEDDVPGYTKKIEGYNITNTLI